jgi:altronate hydrolase
MTNTTQSHQIDSTPLHEVAVIVHPDQDHVAVAKQLIPAGKTLSWKETDAEITVRADVPTGHRFAIRSVPAGEWVRQYGQPFARSKGLAPGDRVDDTNVDSDIPEVGPSQLTLRTPRVPAWEGPLPTFEGFHRTDGNVGIRNWVLVVPVSMCAAHEASQIAMRAEMQGPYSRDAYPNVDGVVALPHDGGCGCPYPKAGETTPGAFVATLRILGQHIRHPNVGAALMIELGCEKTSLAAFDRYAGGRDLSDVYGKPVRRLSIQSCGGTAETIKQGLALMPELLEAANAASRAPAPARALALGLECGGSDAFSGLTANPALGHASDLLVSAGGRSIITEVPEFFGAAHLFAERAVDRETARAIYTLIENFKEYAGRSGHTLLENPSPGNKAGGLLNIAIKSLGAMAKSGTAPVKGTLPYGGWVWEETDQDDPRGAGVYLLNTPGYDQLSVPGLVGAGCQVVCFTTGRGTGIGNAIAPVIKISTNSALYQRMTGDIDVNAGRILDNERTLPALGRDIFDEILAVASGKRTRAEINGHREFALWNVEGLWL